MSVFLSGTDFERDAFMSREKTRMKGSKNESEEIASVDRWIVLFLPLLSTILCHVDITCIAEHGEITPRSQAILTALAVQ